jgi:predicted nucleic-acid-binding Zn-ribbon protein
MQYHVGNTKIFCPCCRNDSFELDYRQLNTKGATFLGLDWANRSVAILICQQCSYISWFMADPMEIR